MGGWIGAHNYRDLSILDEANEVLCNRMGQKYVVSRTNLQNFDQQGSSHPPPNESDHVFSAANIVDRVSILSLGCEGVLTIAELVGGFVALVEA